MATKKKTIPDAATFVDGAETSATGMTEAEWQELCAAGEAQRSRVRRGGRCETTYVYPVPHPPTGSRAPAPGKPEKDAHEQAARREAERLAGRG